MPGPVPGIHVFLFEAWMAGTMPAMTRLHAGIEHHAP
jgi:hypothetical protein